MLFEPRPGEILAGKYEVERVLGRGGMGLVVAARHLQLEEKVAIKFLLPEAVSSPEVVGRFAREARAAVRIKSEHVARVSDVGTLESGEPYMVMEYLEGVDLAGWLRQNGALPVEQAVEFVLQASEAIAEAHALGIVHRDLKPANLFVVRRADGLWSIKVLDFGISKVTSVGGTSSAALTQTSAVMGSPLYMPPEQMAASRDVDARSDIWALGVILYELLVGSAPFSGETLPEVCVKIATAPPPPLRNARPDVPPQLEAVIARCLEKDRARRYANIAELALALGDFGPRRARTSVDRILRTIQAAGLSATALNEPVSSDRGSGTTGPLTAAQWGAATEPRGRGKRAVVLAGGAVVVAALGALGFGVARKASSPEPQPNSQTAAPPASSSSTPTSARAPTPPVVSVVPSAVEPSTAAPAVQPAVPVSAEPVTKLSSPKKQSRRAAPAAPVTRASPPAPAAHVGTAVTAAPEPAPRPPEKGNVFDDR